MNARTWFASLIFIPIIIATNTNATSTRPEPTPIVTPTSTPIDVHDLNDDQLQHIINVYSQGIPQCLKLISWRYFNADAHIIAYLVNDDPDDANLICRDTSIIISDLGRFFEN